MTHVPPGLTYAEAGATARRPLPAGYHHLREVGYLGRGRPVFEAAADALLSWRMHRAAGVRIPAGTLPAAPGVTVDLSLGLGPLRASGTCAVVWAVREERRAGFAYGTLPGHPECGEESFVVTLDGAEDVRLAVTAFSRPARWFTRAAGPLVPAFQRRYARHCARVLRAETARAMK
ncbi:DUF1990 family protein [Streptomyces roseifaciens]|uniref:DUF1990 family protein n=1 Tax=Streptomyces roseifaciens TaxID=1488406 RepID=UPI0007182B57|nr:DUF1990 domain-containing protein [Streptomyces roseifaciens]